MANCNLPHPMLYGGKKTLKYKNMQITRQPISACSLSNFKLTSAAKSVTVPTTAITVHWTIVLYKEVNQNPSDCKQS